MPFLHLLWKSACKWKLQSSLLHSWDAYTRKNPWNEQKAPLKRLIQTRPHMSTSRCGNICIRCGFSDRSSVEAAVTEKLWTATHFMHDRFVNLGEEVILTFLWQSGASESATVCFVISLSICYWLLRVSVCERKRVISQHISYLKGTLQFFWK